jgi:hypothetical protein
MRIQNISLLTGLESDVYAGTMPGSESSILHKRGITLVKLADDLLLHFRINGIK